MSKTNEAMTISLSIPLFITLLSSAIFAFYPNKVSENFQDTELALTFV